MEKKKVSPESSVLSDMMQCKQLMRERLLDNMTAQGDVVQGSRDRETTDDEKWQCLCLDWTSSISYQRRLVYWVLRTLTGWKNVSDLSAPCV